MVLRGLRAAAELLQTAEADSPESINKVLKCASILYSREWEQVTDCVHWMKRESGSLCAGMDALEHVIYIYLCL